MALIVAGCIMIFINILAYWHRDRVLYLLAGFACLLFGFSYWGSSAYLSILVALLGIYNFFKMAEARW